MITTLDAPDDWTALASTWQDAPAAVTPSAEALRIRLERDRRHMRRRLLGEITLSITALASAMFLVQRFPGPWSTFVALDTLGMVALLWVFALWNLRGTWRPLGHTTDAFIRLARLRCTRRLQALYWGAMVTVLQVVAVFAWSRTPDASSGAPAMPGYVLALPALVIVTTVALIVRTRRRIRRKLVDLDELVVQLRA